MPEEKSKKEESIIPTLRTYKTDTAEYVLRQGISRADIALKEAEKRRARPSPEQRTKKWKIILLIGSLIIVGVGGMLTWSFSQKETPVKPASRPPIPLIFSDQEKILTTANRAELISVIEAEIKDLTLTVGSLKYLAVAKEETEGQKQFLDSKEFLNLLEINPPASLSQALTGRFYFGILASKFSDINLPILVFEVKSFEQSFAGMLKWEQELVEDLGFLIPEALNEETGINTFTDKIIKNQDVRLIENTSGQPILLYAFFNKRLLIITFSQTSLEKAFDLVYFLKI